jgi:hypothetical protein
MNWKRMMLFSGALLTALMTLPSGCPPPGIFSPSPALNLMVVEAQAATLSNVAFDYDFTVPKNKPCGGTVTVNCVSGFMISRVNSAGAVVGTPINVPLPATPNTTGLTHLGVNPFTPPANLGSYQVVVNVLYKDASGTVQTGPAVGQGINILPDPPQNLVVS